MVPTFNDWCFDSSRKTGDTGVVESDYGAHVMYFVGNTEQTYRDYLIESDLRTADTDEWYNGLLDTVTVTDGNTDYIRKDLVLGSAS